MQTERLEYLIGRYLQEEITPAEIVELNEVLTDPAVQEQVELYIHNQLQSEELNFQPNLGVFQANLAIAVSRQVPVRKIFVFRWMAAAAVVLFAIATTYFVLNRNEKPVVLSQAERFKADANPAKTKAVLTLADGSKILIDSSGNGIIAAQGNTQVINNNGELTYKGDKTTASLYNTFSTGKGERSPPLTLSDGTKVWLDAASSIRFPVAFHGKERVVEITGQPYFEVAHNTNMPFIVNHGSQQVEVLGTHFNIYAYNDQKAMKVTLLEGSVKVRNGSNVALISPGQQALLSNASGTIDIIPDIDTEEVMAWHNGKFLFNNVADIKTVMEEVGRWYNMEIEFKGNVDGRIWGSFSRELNVVKVLEKLELLKEVEFRTEGNKIIVYPVKK